LIASLERALDLAGGVVLVTIAGEERLHSRTRACARCDVSVADLSPRAFSFNSAYGACPACQGLGWRWRVDADKVFPDPRRPLGDGAIHPWQGHGSFAVRAALEDVAARHGFSLDHPLDALPRPGRRALLTGDGQFPGILTDLMGRAQKVLALAADGGDSDRDAFENLRPYLTETRCASCGGGRLRPESLAVRLGGRSIAEYARLTIQEAAPALRALPFADRERPVADRILPDILDRLGFLERVGVGYLTLDRATPTLSAGEAHRVRLAGQIGARLQGIVYVLDEPSVGLHQRDNDRLLGTLRAIRDLGNTVVVVEHDAETIRAADYVVDLGEGAGRRGGRLMYQGPPASLNGSLTGRYLRGELTIPVPPARRAGSGMLRILGAREHNLRGIDVSIPLGTLTVVSGVSGSGKSTLVDDILFRALSAGLRRKTAAPGRHQALEGAAAVEDVVAIDQRPIGRTPRSNPATYTGALGAIREMFSLVPEARARGYRSGRFSFNVKGGRCEACQGDGVRPIRMHFLPDVHVRCEACRGRRYNRETLEILFHGRTIADVLDLTVDEAGSVLGAHPRLRRLLATLSAIGLGYLRLGQSAGTLSGGEAQRV
jgi:excinuclease ABC subunit A